jgi:hypothetical protein
MLLYVKVVVVALYLAFIYWLSLHIAPLAPLFFPTLGAFSYFLITNNPTARRAVLLVAGASLASLLGAAAFLWLPEMPAILGAFILTVVLIRRFHLNAPPILAIALIPFFDRPQELWSTPMTVFVTLTILVALLLLVSQAATSAAKLQLPFRSKVPVQNKSLRS